MGLGGVTTIGREGELRDALSVSLSEAAVAGRGLVRIVEMRRMTLPMRADHFGLGLELSTD